MKTNEEITQIVTDLVNKKYLFELATEDLFNNVKKDLSELLENEVVLSYNENFVVYVTTDDGILEIEF